MNKSIIKQLFKSNLFIIGLFTAILLMYQLILIFMYTPSFIDKMTDMAGGMGSMGNIYGMNKMPKGFSGYFAQFYYGTIIPLFTLVYNIIVGNKIIAGRVDKGSMSCLLATPNTRNQISISSGIFFLLSNAVIIIINTIIGYICCLAYKEADISLKHTLILMAGALLMTWTISAICYFFSCMFNESKQSLAFGAGIPILFFLFYMLKDFGEKLEVFKKFTIFSLYMPDKIAKNDYSSYLIGFGVLAAIIVILYFAGVKIFNKKDIPV